MKGCSKVVVTGGAGCIGSHLVEGLLLLNAYDKLKFMGGIYY